MFPEKLSIKSKVRLIGGVEMPVLGLGVYQSGPGDETREAVVAALEAGYRHIDTAAAYGNEADVGAALRASAVARSEVFVTTKLWNSDQGYDEALRAFDESLAALGLDYVDLYLIHWPVPGQRLESWRALERVLKEGRARAIGVSNYMEQHLNELFECSDTVPAVNQVEFSPYLYLRPLLELCRANGIQLEAYSPLTRGLRLDDARLAKIAARHRKTPAQVLIRWGLQHEVVEIPKSVRPERIHENAAVFDFVLSADEMRLLDGLDEGLHTAWDPTNAP